MITTILRWLALRLAPALFAHSLLAILLGSCGGGPTSQIVVVIDTGLCEPGDGPAPDFDRVDITVAGVDAPFCAVFGDPGDTGCESIASADFPLVLPLLSDSGAGTPEVRVELSNGGTLVGCATGTPAFVQDQTVTVRIDVERACGAVTCNESITLLEDVDDPNDLPARACEPPVRAPEGAILRIAAGAQHACLVDSSGDLFCWGNDERDQLGVGGDASTRPLPTPTRIPSGFVEDVDGGQSHTCAVVEDGGSRSVRCWGLGSDGQLGNDQLVSSPNPVSVVDSAGAREVALGPFHSCARFAPDGQVRCWGRNTQGEIDGSPGDAIDTPREVPLPDAPGEVIPNALEITAGGSGADEARHSCARTSGETFCWGADDAGQLGRAGEGPAVGAVEATGVVLTQLAAGSRDTCAVDDAGQILCWGRNSPPGTLGIPTDTLDSVETPTRITADTAVLPAPSPTVGGSLSTLASGDNFHCFIDTDGRVFCFGDDSRDRLGSSGGSTAEPREVALPPGMRFKQVVAGTNFACALPEDGGGLPYCWGDNTVGQLGRGTSGGTGTPAPIPSCE